MFRVTILGVLCLLSGSLALAETTAGLHTRNGVTMAPLAVVVTWLGGTMSVPAPDRSVTVRWGHDSLRLSLDSTVAVRNDETVLLERLPALEEQVLYVPLSLLRSAFKVTLTWDATQSTATLTHPQIAKPLVLVLVKTAVELRQELDMAIFQGMLEAVKSIISAHPELLNAKNPQGILPLGQAIAYQQHDIVNYLIAQGVDLKPMLPLQLTYLHLAAAEYDDTALLALLVKKGLAVNATADKGMTPLLAVCCTTQNIDNVRWLLEHGAHPDAALKLSKEELERVNDAQRAVMTAPWFGTALCLAVMYEHPELEQLLLQHHATPLTPEARQQIQRAFTNLTTKAREAQCQANLRQIASACLMYAQAHRETLPIADTIWKDVRVPLPLLFCKEAKTLPNGYGYNALLSGKMLQDIKDPSHTLLFADCKSADHLIHSFDDIDQHRHANGFVAVFCDGHVEHIGTIDPAQLMLEVK